MTKILNIAVDAMGGEGSPKKTIDGIIHHSKSTKNINYNIFGDEKEINDLIKNLKGKVRAVDAAAFVKKSLLEFFILLFLIVY